MKLAPGAQITQGMKSIHRVSEMIADLFQHLDTHFTIKIGRDWGVATTFFDVDNLMEEDGYFRRSLFRFFRVRPTDASLGISHSNTLVYQVSLSGPTLGRLGEPVIHVYMTDDMSEDETEILFPIDIGGEILKPTKDWLWTGTVNRGNSHRPWLYSVKLSSLCDTEWSLDTDRVYPLLVKPVHEIMGAKAFRMIKHSPSDALSGEEAVSCSEIWPAAYIDSDEDEEDDDWD